MADNRAKIMIDVLPPHTENERAIVCSFLNFALDKALELHLAAL